MSRSDGMRKTRPVSDSRDAHNEMPLFYKRPEVLSTVTHAHWRIKVGDLGFAAQTQFVPVAASEFVMASHKYPLLFGSHEHLPVALLGLKPHNSFVKGESWQEDAYVPAYVRRYPFCLTAVDGNVALAIDTEAPQLIKSGQEGEPLFVDGKPSPLTEKAWQFCDTFSREFAATESFVKLLVKHKLLIQRVLDINLPNETATSLTGFYLVDAEAFQALPDELLADWHRKGILALIYAHLNSLTRLPALALPGG